MAEGDWEEGFLRGTPALVSSPEHPRHLLGSATRGNPLGARWVMGSGFWVFPRTARPQGYPTARRLHYPSGLVIDFAPDALGRPTQVAGPIQDYASAIRFHPNDQLAGLTYGNGHLLDIPLDGRQRTDQMAVPGVVDLDYGYDLIGNVTAIRDGIDTAQDRILGYDDFHRLTAATGAWGSATFGYNVRGDLEFKDFGNERLVLSGYDRKRRLRAHRLHHRRPGDDALQLRRQSPTRADRSPRWDTDLEPLRPGRRLAL